MFSTVAIREVILDCRMLQENKQDIIASLKLAPFQYVHISQVVEDEVEFKMKFYPV